MRHPHHWNRLAWMLGLLGLLGAAPALAQINRYADVSVYASHTREDPSQHFEVADTNHFDGPGPFSRLRLEADSDGQQNLYNGLAIAWAQLATGGVHLYAQSQSVSWSTDQRHTVGSARASGILTDSFGLNIPGAAAGSLYTVTAQVRIDGFAWASTLPVSFGADAASEVAAFSGWQSWIKLSQGASGPTLVELRASETCDQRTSVSKQYVCVASGPRGLQEISFQIVNQGAPLQLVLNASVRAGTSNYQRDPGQMVANSGADMGHTLAWAGVTELRDASGAQVGDFSLLSASSGFDYRNAYVSAVPDAPQVALLAAGLALIGLVRRRRLQVRR